MVSGFASVDGSFKEERSVLDQEQTTMSVWRYRILTKAQMD